MPTTTDEAIEYCKRSMADRRNTARDLRAQAIGTTVEHAQKCLELAKLSECAAGGMMTTLNILFDLNLKDPTEA